MKPEDLLKRLRSGNTANVQFDDFCALVEAYGFRPRRVTGSHRTYAHPRVQRLVNLQPLQGEVKGYQARQFLKLVEHYGLEWDHDDE